uniref:(northern house mosquito) hypothetical protein n=1 Tax=Culex pipiens TaxID=7175 RepID=A0A8D8B5H4_CULPI
MHKLVRRHRQMVVLGLHNHARVLRPVVDMMLLLLVTTIVDHHGMLMTGATRFEVVQKSVIVVVIVVVDLVKLVVVMVPVEVPIRGHAVPVEATGHRKVLIHVVVLLLLVLLDERRVRDVRGVQVGLPVRAAAAVGTGRKWS